MLNDLHILPPGIAETSAIVARLDEPFRAGFAGGRHQDVLTSIERIFAGSPLEMLLAESVPALGRGELQERHFVALAAARAALQGAQYDTLLRQVRSALGRPAELDAAPDPQIAMPEPILDGIRHWLMELAITGFARLDANAVQPFLTTLAQIRERPKLARLSFLLTGLTDELLAAAPVTRPEDMPLLRWCDMWSTAMLNAIGSADCPELQPVAGTLYPLGLELRENAQIVSVVVYAVLANDSKATLVRLTWSRFKVEAIRGDTIWLLFPDVEPLLDALSQGRALDIRDMPLLPSGDILWDAERARLGEKCRPLDIAARSLAPQASDPAFVTSLPPLDRHPVQLAEPIVLMDYTLQDDELQLPDDVCLPLDTRWNANADFTRDALASSAVLFGLLRFDAGRWALQPLAGASRAGKLTFVGQSGAKLFKKPPKINAVAILEERASRLLRK
jgi:hypothetical protein